MYFFGFSPSYVFKCVSSNRLYTRRQNHTDCIYFTFPPVCYQMRPQNCFIWGYIIMRCRDFIQWSQYSVCRVDDWNKNNREYGVFTMRWNLPSGYIITLAALYVSSALGRWEAIVINSNIHHRSQVLKRLQLLPSHHFIATIDIWASIVQ